MFDLISAFRFDISKLYFELGFAHILPFGADHILFILCIYLSSPRLKTVLLQATAFTVAHSITLALSLSGYINLSSSIVEPLIAFSILYVAIENIFYEKPSGTRLLSIFVFGLLHGLGFAGVLRELGLPQKDFYNALISFNIGVEFGQLTVIIAAWLLYGKWFSDKFWYRKYLVRPLSGAIAVIAAYWTIERILV